MKNNFYKKHLVIASDNFTRLLDVKGKEVVRIEVMSENREFYEDILTNIPKILQVLEMFNDHVQNSELFDEDSMVREFVEKLHDDLITSHEF